MIIDHMEHRYYLGTNLKITDRKFVMSIEKIVIFNLKFYIVLESSVGI